MNENLKNEFDGQSADLNNNEQDTTQDYILALQRMKETTVSRDKYNEAIAENRKLIKALTNGETIAFDEKKPEVNLEQIRKELFDVDGHLTNLQYVEKTLQLRDALMENGEPDPFLPVSSKFSPSADEIAKAENVAAAFRQCVEYADGDSEVFTNELMRITNDVRPMSGGRRR